MAMTRIPAIFCLALAMYAAVHYTEANPTRTVDINSIFLGLCPDYNALDNQEEQENPECSDQFINDVQNKLETVDAIVYFQKAQDGQLGLKNEDGAAFESACDVLEHLCTPLITVDAGARFRRQASNSTSDSASASASDSASAESA